MERDASSTFVTEIVAFEILEGERINVLEDMNIRPEIDDCINGYRDGILGEDFLRRNFKRKHPQIHFPVSVNAGHNEEDAGPLGTAWQEATLKKANLRKKNPKNLVPIER